MANLTLPFHTSLGFKNIKPDALSCVFKPPEREAAAKPIIPEGVVVWALSWEIEQRVDQAGQGVEVPAECPDGRLLVSVMLVPEVLQWGHSFKLVCHLGIQRMLAALHQHA